MVQSSHKTFGYWWIALTKWPEDGLGRTHQTPVLRGIALQGFMQTTYVTFTDGALQIISSASTRLDIRQPSRITTATRQTDKGASSWTKHKSRWAHGRSPVLIIQGIGTSRLVLVQAAAVPQELYCAMATWKIAATPQLDPCSIDPHPTNFLPFHTFFWIRDSWIWTELSAWMT